jgi:phosphotransferase system HPr (HPr) family protein
MISGIEGPAVSGEPKVVHGRQVRQTFVVNLDNGLHARPCALLVKVLRPFTAKVEVQANSEMASGHSIMGLMALAAGYGTEITFTITGKEAAQAMDAVREVFATRFEGAYRHPVYGPSRG